MRDVTPGTRIAFSSPYTLSEADTAVALWASGLCSLTLQGPADCTLPTDFCIWTAGWAEVRSGILLLPPSFPSHWQAWPWSVMFSYGGERRGTVASPQRRQCFMIGKKRTGWRSCRPLLLKSWVITWGSCTAEVMVDFVINQHTRPQDWP